MNVNLLTQTIHTIEDVFFPGPQKFATIGQARLFDLAIVKLGEIFDLTS